MSRSERTLNNGSQDEEEAAMYNGDEVKRSNDDDPTRGFVEREAAALKGVTSYSNGGPPNVTFTKDGRFGTVPKPTAIPGTKVKTANGEVRFDFSTSSMFGTPTGSAPPITGTTRFIEQFIEEFRDMTDLPVVEVNALVTKLTSTRVEIPFGMNDDFSRLLDASYQLIVKKITTQRLNEFIKVALLNFEKTILDTSCKDWSEHKSLCVWFLCAQYIKIFGAMLANGATDPDVIIPCEIFYTAFLMFTPTSPFYEHVKLHYSSLPLSIADGDRLEEFTKLNLLSLRAGDKQHHKALILVFAKYDGFENLRKYLLSGKIRLSIKTEDVYFLIRVMKFLVSLTGFVSPRYSAIAEFTEKLVEMFENTTDAEWKYSEIKSFMEFPPSDLLVMTKELAVNLLRINSFKLPMLKRLDDLQLTLILKTIKNAKLTGRTTAIEELQRVFFSVAQHNNYEERNLVVTVCRSFEDLVAWARKHDLLSILVRDNLHLVNYVDRIEKLFQVLIRREVFNINDLDLVWESQWGKHDAVQRNMLNMISRLARFMQLPLLDRIFDRIRDSFQSSMSPREKNLLLDFIRNLIANQIANGPSDLNQKAFDLTWELFHVADLALENIEMLLNVRVAIINSARNPDALRRQGFLKCVDEIRKNSEFSVPLFLHIRHCVCDPLERRKKFSTSKAMVSLIQSENTISVLIDSLAAYLGEARNILQTQKNVTNFPIESADFQIPNSRYTHQFQVNTRLDAILFFIAECSERDQYASVQVVIRLWNAIIENPVSEFERYRGFNFFGTHLNRFSPQSMLEMFRSCLLKFPPKFFTLLSFNEICVMLKTATADHLSTLPYSSAVTGLPDSRSLRIDYLMKARGYLWKVIVEAPDNVAHRAIEFATCEMDNMTDPHRRNAHATQFIDDCFNRLQICDRLLRVQGASNVIDKTAQQAQRVSKALKVLLLRYENNFQNRIHPPLYRACMGRCYPVVILICRDESKTKGTEGRKVLNVNSNWTMRHFHSQVMQVISMDKSPHQILNMGRMDLLSYHPTFGMTPTEAQVRVSNMLLNMKSDRFAPLNQHFPDLLRLVGRNSMRKTLGELHVDDSTIFAVRFTKSRHDTPSYNFVTTMTRGDTPESSGGELSDPEDDFATDDEYIMPAIILANHQERIFFLMDLADYAHKIGKNSLRDEIANLMDHFSVTNALRTTIEEAVANNTLRDTLITASPTRTCFLFQVLHSILMPVVFTESFLKTETTFIASDSMNAFFVIFQGSLFQNGDYYPAIMTRILLSFVRMVKFSSMAHKKIRHAIKVADGSLSEPKFQVPESRTAQDNFYTIFMLDILRCAFDGLSEKALYEQACNFEIPMSILQSLMFISWTASRSNVNGITNRRAPNPAGTEEETDAMDTSSTLSESSFEGNFFDDANMLRLADRQDSLCELLSLEALDAFVEATNFCPEAVSLFHVPEHLFKGEVLILPSTSMNPSFYEYAIDCMLNATSEVVRMKISRAFMDMLLMYKARDADYVQGPNAQTMLDALFSNLSLAEVNWIRAAQFFECLFHLMDYCQRERIFPNQFGAKFLKVITWLKAAKDATHEKGSTFQREELLVYYLKTATHILRLAPQPFRATLGASGNNILQELFDDFLMPFCKSYIALENEDENLNAPVSPVSSEASVAMTKPNKTMPICRSDASVSACFALVMDIVRDVPDNLEQTLEHLKAVLYRDISIVITNELPPPYFPRDPTVFVGLKNAGATCYMNSVIQQLFMIEGFRNIILNAKVDLNLAEGDTATNRVSPVSPAYENQLMYTVQNMFAHLLASEEQFFTPLDFWDIFQFGGRDVNVREQQDAVEFFNAFADGLDESLKKIGEIPIFEKLFGGTFADQKKCRDCPHMYEKEQLFTSIAVDIRSHNNLRASLNEYVTGDLLEGDNAYYCEKCDEKVTAVKRMCIQKLPPFLMFQLKRFDMDWNRGTPVKFFDYFEFPMLFDMEPFTSKGVARRETMSCEESPPETAMYRLRGVVVHSGEAHGGHYYSFIADNKEDGKQQWYRFDDTDVTAWDHNEIEARCSWFGGYNDVAFPTDKDKRRFSAYMLVYEAVNSDATVPAPNAAPHSPSPPNVPSPNVNTMDMRFGSMSLHSRRSTTNRLPQFWERIVTKDNLRFAYERFQYSPTFFRFIRDVTRFAALQCTEGIAPDPIRLAQKATYILGCFLYSTAIRIPNELRNSGIREWLITVEALFTVPRVAIWFLNNFITKGNVLSCSILHCSSNLEVRKFLEQLVIIPLKYSLLSADTVNDSLQHVDPEGNTAVDETLRKLVLLCKASTVDFYTNGVYVIDVLKTIAQDSLSSARRLINHNALYAMLTMLTSREENRVRIIVRDNPEIFMFISALMTACTGLQKPTNNVVPNPFARPSRQQLYMPENVQAWFNSQENCHRFFYLLFDCETDFQVTCDLCCYLVWRNRLLTNRLLQVFPYYSGKSIAKTLVRVFKTLVSLEDGLQHERLRYACIGEPGLKIVGLFTAFSAACIQNKVGQILYTLLEFQILLHDDYNFRTKLATVPSVRTHIATLVSCLEKALDPQSTVTKSIFPYSSTYRENFPLIQECYEIYSTWLAEMNSGEESLPLPSPSVFDEGLGEGGSPSRFNGVGEGSNSGSTSNNSTITRNIPLSMLMPSCHAQQLDDSCSEDDDLEVEDEDGDDPYDSSLMMCVAAPSQVSPNSPIKAGKKRHFDRPLHGGSNSSLPSYEVSMSQPTCRKIRHEQSPHASPVKFPILLYPSDPPPSYDECLTIRTVNELNSPMQVTDDDHDSASSSPLNPNDHHYTGHYHRDDPPFL